MTNLEVAPVPVNKNNINFCRPWPCNTAAETLLRPLIWCFQADFPTGPLLRRSVFSQTPASGPWRYGRKLLIIMIMIRLMISNRNSKHSSNGNSNNHTNINIDDNNGHINNTVTKTLCMTFKSRPLKS